ncbi:MAG TPA: O-antigen ligase family protein [Bryobacteraceae bacterium]|nr:O-antigen ligase family protein [Bryobacteraceae bacterium]
MATARLGEDSSLLQRAGFALLCIFLISGFVNEFAMRLFHVKAYISTVSWVLLPILLVLSGRMLRGFRDITGWLWLGFLAWICLATPFSVWRGGSLAILRDYIPHAWIQFYIFAAFVVSAGHLRRVMYFLIASDLLLLIDCWWGGSMANGRLEIPDSMFFRNANDLSLQLLLAVTQFLFLVHQRQRWKQIAGGAAILASLLFIFKTGARGAFLAVFALLLVGMLIGKHRFRLAALGPPALAGALLMTPSGVLHRMTLIGNQPQAVAASDPLGRAAVESEQQRLALLRQSLSYALLHPLLGVGPGQFAVAASNDLAREGKPAPWLGTHNSYTEVASECGIPAFLLYGSVLFLALRSNFRIYRRTANLDDTDQAGTLAFCLFASAVVYAICTLFFHVAYSTYLPMIAGMSVALRLAVDRRLWSNVAAREA